MLVLKSLALPSLFKKSRKVAQTQTDAHKSETGGETREGFFSSFEKMLGSVTDLIIEPYDK